MNPFTQAFMVIFFFDDHEGAKTIYSGVNNVLLAGLILIFKQRNLPVKDLKFLLLRSFRV